MAANFRDYVPPPDHPKIKDLHKFDARTYSENAVNAPGPQRIVSKWVSKLDEPFFGITVDGTRKEGLFHLEDEGAPVEQMVDRANRILQLFDPLELQKFSHEIDSDNWLVKSIWMLNGPIWGANLCLQNTYRRKWSNPEFIIYRTGIIDSGPDNGVRILDSAGSLPLTLMQSLPKDLQDRAQVHKTLHDEQMPDDRWNPADQRHLGGAFQDNRVIPNEGIQVEQMPQPQQEDLLHLISFYLDILPSGPYNARVNQVKRHWNETYFCWIGGYGDEDAFYYRIQSPVLMIEFDHHSGVFLLNKEPAKYHIHTIVRTPNGNDYGREWIRLHRRRFY
ncbi:Protein of unknown function DUF3500 [Aspergillus parasiticus SU-1]|uniref:DUF3500 domain-containing protein n=1 Tax=Aspergillus parasiticus (strain ATCC 56775 / NRRL 5862 / SRRC 143 / SU-1) TaxID=1403190 RepID=A0A0F0ILW8_ASPPU|nr:Protein of unknown function DUF3500 [Aspergillus parasiticus SU-1]